MPNLLKISELPNANALSGTEMLPGVQDSTTKKFTVNQLAVATAAVVIVPSILILSCSDETTALTAGTAKLTFRMPHIFMLTGVRASLNTAQASGSIFTVDVNAAGTSILSTKVTIDNTEKTSVTAATPSVIVPGIIPDDTEITVDIDQIGNGTAAGLKITLLGYTQA